jgi:hypothetical protein
MLSFRNGSEGERTVVIALDTVKANVSRVSQIGRAIIVPLRSRPGTSTVLVGVFDPAGV